MKNRFLILVISVHTKIWRKSWLVLMYISVSKLLKFPIYRLVSRWRITVFNTMYPKYCLKIRRRNSYISHLSHRAPITLHSYHIVPGYTLYLSHSAIVHFTAIIQCDGYTSKLSHRALATLPSYHSAKLHFTPTT